MCILCPGVGIFYVHGGAVFCLCAGGGELNLCLCYEVACVQPVFWCERFNLCFGVSVFCVLSYGSSSCVLGCVR